LRQPSNAPDSLGAWAASRGLIFGAAIQAAMLTDAPYAAAFAAEAALIGSENDFKWAATQPAADRFNFDPADAVTGFARANGQLLRGHNLAWHMGNPAWLEQTLTPANAKSILVNHVETVVSRYAGQMHSWDVVNEAVLPSDGRADGLRKSLWLAALGPGYIDMAFQTAAAADPKALLVYNDFGLEYSDTSGVSKRTAVLQLLGGMLGRGVPVGALGIQGHLSAGRIFEAGPFVDFLGAVGRLGLQILVTELDVDDSSLPADTSERDRSVAAVYEQFAVAALSAPAVIQIMTWGLSDRHSYLNVAHARADGLPQRPLPLDAALARKPAWDALATAFGSSG
jgi:endo-1,4-beta-xylanase